MLPEIEQIRRRRLGLGLTQAELARMAGVSQSLIAKLERGRLRDASYSAIKRIFEALERAEAETREVPAKSIANSPVAFACPADPVGKAIGLMERHGYSQLPVLEGTRAVGSISEGDITRYLAEGGEPSELRGLPVRELMGEPFPLVGEETPSRAVVGLLEHFPAVLTTRRGRITGIITKADLFKIVRER